VELLKERCTLVLAGNHDRAAIGLTDADFFNTHAKAAILWTRATLTDHNRSYLATLPVSGKMRKKNMLFVHSTPKEPEQWHYLLTLWDAEINFHYFDERICIIGHSHLPFVIERLPSGEMLTHKSNAALRESGRYIINAGSVGQPRDRDPRACYLLVGRNQAEFVRVEYRRAETQRKMREAGLPLALIERLSQGA
jgi:diadenosine tetraphosphatase ApaH/serine/threonine PP2A family protein phosphatase